MRRNKRHSVGVRVLACVMSVVLAVGLMPAQALAEASSEAVGLMPAQASNGVAAVIDETGDDVVEVGTGDLPADEGLPVEVGGPTEDPSGTDEEGLLPDTDKSSSLDTDGVALGDVFPSPVTEQPEEDAIVAVAQAGTITLTQAVLINASNKSTYEGKTVTGTVPSTSEAEAELDNLFDFRGAIVVDGIDLNLTISNFSVDYSGKNNPVSGISLVHGATLHLTVRGINTLKGGFGGAGISVPQYCTLEITDSSDGTLNAIGGDNFGGGAGIGDVGDHNNTQYYELYPRSMGDVIINGGTINAVGASWYSQNKAQSGSAGIGSGEGSYRTGSITITGGTVTATGGFGAAGIGGGTTGTLQMITISGGTVIANGSAGGAAIGTGYNTYTRGSGNVVGPAVSITGGTVTANGNIGFGKSDYVDQNVGGSVTIGQDVPVTCKGSVSATEINWNVRITFDPNGGTGYMDDEDDLQYLDSYELPDCRFRAPTGKLFYRWQVESNGVIREADPDQSITLIGNTVVRPLWKDYRNVTFNANGHGSAPIDQKVFVGEKASRPNSPTAEGWLFMGWYTEPECKNLFDFNREVTEDVTLYAGWVSAGTERITYIYYEYGDSGITATHADAVCGSYAALPAQTVWGTTAETIWYVADGNTSVNGRVEVLGNVHLILLNGVTLTVHGGINVASGGSLSVYAQSEDVAAMGALIVDEVGENNAGIGCGAGCTVTINGGKVTVTGGVYGAGIGGGAGASAGTVTINGGIVKATGGNCGAGIGGGDAGTSQTYDLAGTVVLNGGKVEANGGSSAAGIGGGMYGGGCAVTVNGCAVTANEGIDGWAAGVGPGYYSKVSTPGSLRLSLGATGSFRASSYANNSNKYTSVHVGKDGTTEYAKIKDGDGDAIYTGDLAEADLRTLAGKTLVGAYTHKGSEYTIYTTEGWDAFCDLLAKNEKGYFDGKRVYLGADITVTRMAGISQHDFTGTFDGKGHTLTVNYDTNEQYAAPFRYVVGGCTIRHLHVDGTISTSEKYAAGIVSKQYGTVKLLDCRSSVTIRSSVPGDGTHGGLVAYEGNSTNDQLTIEGCAFDGKLLSVGSVATTNCAGFVGYKGSQGTLTLTDCLYAPADIAGGESAISDGSATFVRNDTNTTYTNCYYADALGAEQGTRAYRLRGDGIDCSMFLYPAQTYKEATGMTVSDSGAIFGGAVYFASTGEKDVYLTRTGQSGGTFIYYVATAADGTEVDITWQKVGLSSVFVLNMPAQHVELSAQYANNNDLDVNDTEYTIRSAEGWNNFCAVLVQNPEGFFGGKTVRLSANISVTRMAGDEKHKFTGIFDGQDYSLSVNYENDKEYTAPFRYVGDGCEIRHLHINGTISTSAKYAAGFVGIQHGTVKLLDCRSSVTIRSNVSGDGTHSGFVAKMAGNNDSKLTIEGCVFDGKLLSTGSATTTNCAGFLGWRDDVGKAYITDCLYAPADAADGESAISSGATFARNAETSSITNCYYTQVLGTQQGKRIRSIVAGEYTDAYFAGICDQYVTSGIVSFGTGIVYHDVLCAGAGDEVVLSLGHRSRGGYDFVDFEAKDASQESVDVVADIIGYALTMPDSDVTVSAAWEAEKPAFKSQSLILSGQIGVNFYADLSMLTEDEREAVVVEFDVGGRTYTDTFDPLFKNSTGKLYGFTCPISSAQMGESIKATLHYGDGATARAAASVREYVAYIVWHSNGYTEAEIALAKAIANYGHYMTPFIKKYGSGVDSNVVGIDSYGDYTNGQVVDNAKQEVAKGKLSLRDDAQILADPTYKLILGSETTIRIYFRAAEGHVIADANQVSVKDEDGVVLKKAAVMREGDRWCVRIPNIGAAQLADRYTVTITDKGTADANATIELSALSYAYTVMTNGWYDGDDRAMTDRAMASLYYYHKAAAEYIGKG